MTDYAAIVYDLDGTLVRLDVDWGAVRDRCGAILSARGLDVAGVGLWELRELARDHGVLDRVDERIAEFERDGARRARQLPVAAELPHGVPVAVCSLNDGSACRLALELHGLDGYVDAIVGRDAVAAVKPDPGHVLAAVEALRADPARTLFVGDSERDQTAARRAGVDFQWAADRG